MLLRDTFLTRVEHYGYVDNSAKVWQSIQYFVYDYTWDAVMSVNLNIPMVRCLHRHFVCTMLWLHEYLINLLLTEYDNNLLIRRLWGTVSNAFSKSIYIVYIYIYIHIYIYIYTIHIHIHTYIYDAIFYYRRHSCPAQYGTWFSRDHYCQGRSKPVCWILRLATCADVQERLMSAGSLYTWDAVTSVNLNISMVR